MPPLPEPAAPAPDIQRPGRDKGAGYGRSMRRTAEQGTPEHAAAGRVPRRSADNALAGGGNVRAHAGHGYAPRGGGSQGLRGVPAVLRHTVQPALHQGRTPLLRH